MGGKGLQTDPPPHPPCGRGLQVDLPGYYHRPPLFYGTWSQQGSGKRKTPRPLPEKKKKKEKTATKKAKENTAKKNWKGLFLGQNFEILVILLWIFKFTVQRYSGVV